MMTGWSSDTRMRSARMRVRVSLGPPAPNGTMIVIGREGWTCAGVRADLEHAIGVRLLDRSQQGIEPTMYGDALLKRSIAVFDELKQSVRDIEHLADPTTGEIRIACALAIAFTVIPHVFERFVKKY